jgi:hypothetical protein
MANGHVIVNMAIHPIEYFINSDDAWADFLPPMRLV